MSIYSNRFARPEIIRWRAFAFWGVPMVETAPDAGMSPLTAELHRLGRWVEYLNEQRESHMTKIAEFETALAKLSEAFTASVVKHDEEKAAWASERVVYEDAIDRSIEKVCELYDNLTGRELEMQPATVASDPPQDP